MYPAWNLNQDFTDRTPDDFTLADVISTNRELLDVRPEGYAVYKPEPNIVFIPEHSHYSMRTQTISWTAHGAEQTIKLLAGKHYLSPDGYRIHAKHREMDATQWHLIGTSSRAVTCHKPATVSGGGKSEISKSISDAFVFGNASRTISTAPWTRCRHSSTPISPIALPTRPATAPIIVRCCRLTARWVR